MAVVKSKRGWEGLLAGEARAILETQALPAFLPRQRWFAGKSRSIKSTRLLDISEPGPISDSIRLTLLEVTFDAGKPEIYFLPLGLLNGTEADKVALEFPKRVIARIEGVGVIQDALADADLDAVLLQNIGEGRSIPMGAGSVRGFPTAAFATARGPKNVALKVVGGSFEQSNSAVIFGDRLILKVFRRLEPGINPDFEIGKFLSEKTSFDRIPRCAGALLYERSGAEPLMLGILQGLVPNQGTGWEHALNALKVYYTRASRADQPPPVHEGQPTSMLESSDLDVPEGVKLAIGPYLEAASTLGRRTAEMHLALSSDPTEVDFAAEPLTHRNLEDLAEEIREQVAVALKALEASLLRLPESTVKQARNVLDKAPGLGKSVDLLANLDIEASKIRCHGDYHLGQVLRSGEDFIILDFEGEPAKSLIQRRGKQTPIKDVVGMIRSFDYAAFAALFAFAGDDARLFDRLTPWAISWRTWVSSTFLKNYLRTAHGASFLPKESDHLSALLTAMTLDKALYELLYELNNRPDWVRIPLQGIASLIEPAPPAEFPSTFGDLDLYLLGEGTHDRSYEKLGAHLVEHHGVTGVHFAVWAPNAREVSVIGNFNAWNAKDHPMVERGSSGFWERFIPDLEPGTVYKYEILSRVGDYRVAKADPYAFASELRPQTASVVADLKDYSWNDHDWMSDRQQTQASNTAISIYELHLGSWMRGEKGRWLTYRELADLLPDYLDEMGFTHVEFMPVAEHPFDGSWGYQVTGYFAPTSRFGSPQEFMALVDRLHQRGIGVILDWVPAHFPTDEHALGFFDGTHLYEHPDPKQGFHHDWNTFIFNFGRREVVNFLISNALFWLEKYHIDGLRVDAVASMLYRDYSRKTGEWEPNRHGGRENLEAIALLRRFNERVHAEFPDTLTFAEESTSWPMVTRPTDVGGLGFDYKWDLGWMHDTLDYMSEDPINRKFHHNKMTFRGLYAFTESFVLPLSHDEVVYGKGSLHKKMPGDPWRKFANLRLLFGYQFALPGKKLMFMGDEFGQPAEWNHDSSLDWSLLDDPMHASLKRWVHDLNILYQKYPELHELDIQPEGFVWIDANDAEQSVLSFLRRGSSSRSSILFVLNLTPVPRLNYRVGVPGRGRWDEVINSDAPDYGGSGQGNLGGVTATPVNAHGHFQSLNLTLPPLSIIAFRSPSEELHD